MSVQVRLTPSTETFLLVFSLILKKGLTFILKNDRFFTLYFDKTSLTQKFTPYCGSIIRFNYKAMMDGWACHFPERASAHIPNQLLTSLILRKISAFIVRQNTKQHESGLVLCDSHYFAI